MSNWAETAERQRDIELNELEISEDVDLEELDDNSEDGDVTVEANKKPSVLWIVLFSLTWFVSSISLTVYNKFLFGSHDLKEGSVGVRFFPLLTSSTHTAIQFALSALTLCGFIDMIFKFFYLIFRKLSFKSSYQELNEQVEGSDGSLYRPAVPEESFSNLIKCLNIIPFPDRGMWKFIVAGGLSTAFDIGLSNISMGYISVSLYTMIKSSAPMFVLLVSFALGLEKPQLRLFFIILVMSIGVIMMVYREDHHKTKPQEDSTRDYLTGVSTALLASLSAGFRVGLAQVLLQTDHKEIKHLKYPKQIYTMYLLSPIMSVSLFLFSMGVEQPFINSVATKGGRGVHSIMAPIVLFLMMSAGGVIAFFMIMAEFGLIKITSGLFLSVTGILKEIVTICIGVVFMGDQLNTVNVLGLLLSIIAIAYFNYIKLAH